MKIRGFMYVGSMHIEKQAEVHLNHYKMVGLLNGVQNFFFVLHV